jgi:hypothetical protein
MKKVEIEKPEEYLDLVAKKAKEYLYHDHPNEGIDFFCDSEIEDMGYQAVVFDFITYRGIAEFIEENCEGTLTFNDHPMGFNGFVEVDNIEDVREKVKQFIVEKIKSNRLEEYDIDQQESLEFFGIEI